MSYRVSKQRIRNLARRIEVVLQQHAYAEPYVADREIVAALIDVLARKAMNLRWLRRRSGPCRPRFHTMQRGMEKHHAATGTASGRMDPSNYRL